MPSEWSGSKDDYEPSTMDKVNDFISWVASVSGIVVAVLVFIYMWSRS